MKCYIALLSVILACGYWIWWGLSHPFALTVVCADIGGKHIVGEHVRVFYDGRYIMQRSDGKQITYDKTAFEWCIVTNDDDVTK